MNDDYKIEDLENGYKITVPIITSQELKEIDFSFITNYDNIINEISKTVSRDREIIILKRIINYQDKKIKELEKKVRDLL